MSNRKVDDDGGVGGVIGLQYGVERQSFLASTGLNFYYLRSTTQLGGGFIPLYERTGELFFEIPIGVGVATNKSGRSHFEFKGDIAYLTTVGLDRRFLTISPYAAVLWATKENAQIGVVLKGMISTNRSDDYLPSFIGLGLIYQAY